MVKGAGKGMAPQWRDAGGGCGGGWVTERETTNKIQGVAGGGDDQGGADGEGADGERSQEQEEPGRTQTTTRKVAHSGADGGRSHGGGRADGSRGPTNVFGTGGNGAQGGDRELKSKDYAERGRRIGRSAYISILSSELSLRSPSVVQQWAVHSSMPSVSTLSSIVTCFIAGSRTWSEDQWGSASGAILSSVTLSGNGSKFAVSFGSPSAVGSVWYSAQRGDGWLGSGSGVEWSWWHLQLRRLIHRKPAPTPHSQRSSLEDIPRTTAHM